MCEEELIFLGLFHSISSTSLLEGEPKPIQPLDQNQTGLRNILKESVREDGEEKMSQMWASDDIMTGIIESSRTLC